MGQLFGRLCSPSHENRDYICPFGTKIPRPVHSVPLTVAPTPESAPNNVASMQPLPRRPPSALVHAFAALDSPPPKSTLRNAVSPSASHKDKLNRPEYPTPNAPKANQGYRNGPDGHVSGVSPPSVNNVETYHQIEAGPSPVRHLRSRDESWMAVGAAAQPEATPSGQVAPAVAWTATVGCARLSAAPPS